MSYSQKGMSKSKIRHHEEMDAEIVHKLQAEEQANKQCQSFQTDSWTNQ